MVMATLQGIESTNTVGHARIYIDIYTYTVVYSRMYIDRYTYIHTY